MEPVWAVGLMTGTALDGMIDVALVRTDGQTIAELGPWSLQPYGEEAMALIPHLAPRQYVPVDISVDFLQDAARQVQLRFPALDIVGLGMDFSHGLPLPDAVQEHDRVFFYPGSSLGNFTPEQALQFLRHIADPAHGRARGLLLGIDLVKDSATLEAAYDDALGVTAAFNKNLLVRINRELGGHFDLDAFDHIAAWNPAEQRIEMHLVSRVAQTVAIDDAHIEVPFARGERIWTESSYKYTPDQIEQMAVETGFAVRDQWIDPQARFALSLLTAL